MAESTPERPRFRFGLQALFGGVTILAVFMAMATEIHPVFAASVAMWSALIWIAAAEFWREGWTWLLFAIFTVAQIFLLLPVVE